MNIVLLGYMASGKSIIAKKLANKKNTNYIDLDTYIENKEKLKINEIFKNKGEVYFRKIENKFLQEILKNNKNIILAVGGGTPCYDNNMNIILKHSKSFFLKASINTIYDRVALEKNKRPLIKGIKNNVLKEFIAKHLFERSPFYNKANISIIVDNKSVDKITTEILLQISS